MTDVLDDGGFLVEFRLLLEDAYGVSRRQARFAAGDFLDTGHDLKESRLAHAVRPDDADLSAGVEGQGHIIEDDLVAMRFARLVHLVDEFSHGLNLSSEGPQRVRLECFQRFYQGRRVGEAPAPKSDEPR